MSITSRDCVFFYGHSRGDHACFSQFYGPIAFEDENGIVYHCAEQYMMASKARCMNDAATLEAILACPYDPRRIKALGRLVAPFDADKWASVRLAAVTRGNYLKFSQNKALRKVLLQTDGLTLVEAAPHDQIWGIGVSVKDAAAGKKWKGQNLLGQALMAARSALDAGVPVSPPAFDFPASSKGTGQPASCSESAAAGARHSVDKEVAGGGSAAVEVRNGSGKCRSVGSEDASHDDIAAALGVAGAEPLPPPPPLAKKQRSG